MLAAILIAALVLWITGPVAKADETFAESKFDEHRVEFHNQGVKLAGSLLLPKSEGPVPAVVFVHGAGRQTREPYRKVGEYFARHGIAALIYDKRGTGQSGGAYESYEPYENLVNDALSAVAFLKTRREIAPSRIGIWGLSQGAYISAVAASRSADIQFLIVAGADATDGSMFYYRDNLFRRFGLSGTLRDLAEKLHLVEQDLHRTFRDGFRLASLVPQPYVPPDRYVHPAWSHVHKPVLAMWGQLDKKAPVAESIVGFKNSLAQAHNENWTIIILPGINHDLKISETGAIQSKSYGYPPAALQTMTDWAWTAIDGPAEIGKMKQEGVVALETGTLPRFASYERLRWYGNGFVQAALWILFLISFGANTIAGAGCCLAGLFRRRQNVTWPASHRGELKACAQRPQSSDLRCADHHPVAGLRPTAPELPDRPDVFTVTGDRFHPGDRGSADGAGQDSPRSRLDGSEKIPLLTRCSLPGPLCPVPVLLGSDRHSLLRDSGSGNKSCQAMPIGFGPMCDIE
jgi:hypothetical protein